MNVENTDSSDNPLRGRIPSLSEIQDLTAKHREKEEKIQIERCRKAVVKAFYQWKCNKATVKRIKITNIIPRKVQQELKELGYGIEFRAGEWYISW